MGKKTATLVLVVINGMCALFHTMFQLDLLKEPGIYRGFLLVENAMITFFFLYFVAGLLIGGPTHKRVLLQLSIFFWTALIAAAAIVQPPVTTLNLVSHLLIFPQYLGLLSLSVVALLLSIACYRQTSCN